jgi:putative transposase
VSRFRFVEAEAAQFPVSLLCRAVGVTRQGFYAWKRRPPSARELADRELAERIRQIYSASEGIYGAPRIYSELKLGEGIAVGKKRVARLMRELGIRGADGRRGGPRTTVRDPKRPAAPDLVDRDFVRAEPNRLWVCDLKYVQTGQGFLFLAAVQDVFSRRIIGWSMRDDLKAELVLDALGMAVTLRGGEAAGVVAHSDHGSQPEFKRPSQRCCLTSRMVAPWPAVCDPVIGVGVGVGDRGGGVAAGAIVGAVRCAASEASEPARDRWRLVRPRRSSAGGH